MLSRRFCALLAVACVFGTALQIESAKITLEDILTNKYPVRGWSGTWVAGELVQLTSNGNVIRYNPVTGTNETYFDGSEFNNETLYRGRSYRFSADEKTVLVTHHAEALWRHSFTAKYHVRSRVTNGPIVPIKPPGIAEHVSLELVQWSTLGDALIYVYNGNIYYRAEATEPNFDVQLTTTGNTETITNGHTDWVYEEEMFGDNLAAWFSPDGSRLAYIQFNDTEVEEFLYPMYGDAEGRNEDNSYPNWTHIRYPRPGTTNPTATLFVINLPSSISRVVEFPAADKLPLIGTLKWLSNTHFLVVLLDRAQQNANWFRCDVENAGPVACQTVFKMSEPTGWIDISSPVVSSTGNRFLTTRINDDLATTLDYKHIVLVNVTDGVVLGQRITNEAYSVDSILRWDETNNQIYFTATGLSVDGGPEPSTTHVYQISDNQTNARATCITCSLNTSNNEKCLQNSMSFSLSLNSAIHSCGGPVIPETVIRERNNNAWSLTRVVADNNDLRASLQDTELPTPKDFVIPSTGNSPPIRARLFLPKMFDEKKKYPLFIDVYGGPGSQNVRQSFSITWGTSLVSSHDVIYGYIDGRGSARQTGAHLFSMYRKLGTVEIEDQIAGAKALIAQNSFIDANKTAIWGWSYGGYATAMVMAKDTENVFKCGISVAPVTNWLFYDTIYTERFMGEPKDNPDGYKEGDVTSAEHIAGFKTHQFFLVHGNADDNVHYQQSMVLARALEKADVVFEQLSYPDEAHSINGPGMRRHLYHSLEKFLFRDCFPAEPIRVEPPTEAPTEPPTRPPTESPTEPPNASPKLGVATTLSLLFGLVPFILAQILRS